MKGKRLEPTSSLYDMQGNRGRAQEIDYVDDPMWSSVEKFMKYLAECDKRRLSKTTAPNGDFVVS